MVFPTQDYIAARIEQFNADVAKILPPGVEPLVYQPEGQYHWYRIFANNNTSPDYCIYTHRPELSDRWVVVVGGIHSMPGCCGACVITGIGVAERFQRKGIGTLMGKLLLDIGRRYSQAIGTIVPSTETHVQPMHKLADKLGFKVYPESRFTNRNTENRVVTCARPLPA
jgi:RimJ/RimL family protein N-acetyltransferase